MAHRAPGKHFRKGISLIDAVQRFSDEAEAEAWFVERRWPNGIRCPHCGSESIHERANRKPMPYHCRVCIRDFSVRTGTLLHSSKIPLSKWAIAFYLYSTHLKGVSSMKLHRDLGITQKTAWHMAHRIREAWDIEGAPFAGPVEADESFFGGKEKNKHAVDRKHLGRGTVGKAAVVGVKDRSTNLVAATPVDNTDRATLQGFVLDHTDPQALVFTDDHSAYDRISRKHETVRHSVSEYVRGQAHTNGMESFWSMLKRGYVGTYHQMSRKHLGRYVREFAGRHNLRPMDTAAQMEMMARGIVGKRLRYDDLISDGEEAPRRRRANGGQQAQAGATAT